MVGRRPATLADSSSWVFLLSLASSSKALDSSYRQNEQKHISSSTSECLYLLLKVLMKTWKNNSSHSTLFSHSFWNIIWNISTHIGYLFSYWTFIFPRGQSLLTLLILIPKWGWYFCFLVKCLNNYWVACIDIWYSWYCRCPANESLWWLEDCLILSHYAIRIISIIT